MGRPPRKIDEGLFTRQSLAISLLQGSVVLGVVLIIYFSCRLLRGFDEAGARTLTFTTIVIANLGLILTNRSWSETIITTVRSANKALYWVFAGTSAA
jgi:Ca2+-transporting ATPase